MGRKCKKQLKDALWNAKQLPFHDQKNFLISEIRSVVKNASGKSYQMLMRYALNRALFYVDLLEKEGKGQDASIEKNQLDILVQSIEASFRFYEADAEFAKKWYSHSAMAPQLNAYFGIRLAKIYFNIAETIFDASAQYKMMLKIFELLNWDLYRDQDVKIYAEEIVEIYNKTSKMPQDVSDSKALKLIRDLNHLKLKVMVQLIIKNPTLIEERRIAEEERQKRIAAKVATGVCGTEEGSVAQKIEDCSVFTNAKINDFVLVSLDTKNKYEIWKDLKSNLVWGMRLSKSSRRYNIELRVPGEDWAWDNLEDLKNICESYGKNKVFGFGQNLKWRLPSGKEFTEAVKHGGVRVMPDISRYVWATDRRVNKMSHWRDGSLSFDKYYRTYDGPNREVKENSVSVNYAEARCVVETSR